MSTGAGLGRLPYEIMGVMRAGPGSGPPWSLGRRKELHTAIDYVRRLTTAWAQLVGGSAPILYWYVVDVRDGTQHHPSAQPKGETSHGKHQVHKGRPAGVSDVGQPERHWTPVRAA